MYVKNDEKIFRRKKRFVHDHLCIAQAINEHYRKNDSPRGLQLGHLYNGLGGPRLAHENLDRGCATLCKQLQHQKRTKAANLAFHLIISIFL